MSLCTVAQWKNNSNTFIEVEWWGTWNGPKVKLLERPFVYGCLASKSGGYTLHGFLYWEELPANDICECMYHLSEVPYDAFHIPA